MKILIKNEKNRLVYTEKQDLSFVLQTESEYENALNIGQWSMNQHESALEDKDILHLIIQDYTGLNIGYMIARGLTNPNNCIELMRIAVVIKGAGYGKNALSLFMNWCFTERQTHRLWLDVRENNLRAQHVYQKLGFFREGLLRECIKDGDTYQSLVIMSVLKQNYLDRDTGK